jgi:hypothetical protein
VKADGQTYCFETKESLYSHGKQPSTTVMLLNMPEPEKLKIGKLDSGSCSQGPWQMDNFVEFVR